MIKCVNCGLGKENTEFYTQRGTKNGEYTYRVCKECLRLKKNINRKKYISTEHGRMKRIIDGRLHRKRKKLIIYAYKEKSGCSVCGIKNPIVLDFHHKAEGKHHKLKNGSANQNFNQLSWDNLFKEMEKCDVVCSNCHRIITYKKNVSGGIRDVEITD